MQGKCVFTVLVGDYERLNEQPVAATSQIPFICLTDNSDLRSESWQMRRIEPAFGNDPIRSQRDLKIRSHLYLPDFAQTLYIDNSVILKQKPEALFELAAGAPDGLLLPPHSFQATVLDEFLQVARYGLDDGNRIFEQLNHYLVGSAEVVEQRPWWSAIVVRDRDNERLRRFSEIWALHVMRYSRRDQLSLNMALHLSGVQPKPLQIDNHDSAFHSWPHPVDRNRNGGERDSVVSVMPIVARMRRAERLLAESDADTRRLHQEITRLREEIKRLELEATRSNAVLADISEARDAMLRSTSWRLTEPIRKLKRGSAVLSNVLRISVDTGAERPTEPDVVVASGGETVMETPIVAEPEIRVLTPAGHWIYVDPSDTRGQHLIAAKGSLNPPTLLAWQILMSEPGWTHIFDIGANYGEMLVNLKLPEAAEIVAVEPNPAIRIKLEQTLREAKVRADILDVAVSDFEGEGSLCIDKFWSGTTRLARPDDVGGDPIRTVKLGCVMRRPRAPLSSVSALIKIDVEGDEVNVLRGGIEDLHETRRFAALVEVLHVPTHELSWIEQHFDIEMLRLDSADGLVSVPRGKFAEMLATDMFYRQDVVLRRRH